MSSTGGGGAGGAGGAGFAAGFFTLAAGFFLAAEGFFTAGAVCCANVKEGSAQASRHDAAKAVATRDNLTVEASMGAIVPTARR